MKLLDETDYQFGTSYLLKRRMLVADEIELVLSRSARPDEFTEMPIWMGVLMPHIAHLDSDEERAEWRATTDQFLFAANIVEINSKIFGNGKIEELIDSWDHREYPQIRFTFHDENYDAILDLIESALHKVRLRDARKTTEPGDAP